MARWKIDYYVLPSGKIPVKEFIDDLPEKSQSKISNIFDLLIEFGVHLGRPHVKKLSGTPLWELRILGEQSLRFFYILRRGQTFFMLHAFRKKSQKTPSKELKKALKRAKSYI